MGEFPITTRPTGGLDWSVLIPEPEWSLYRAALDAVAARQLRFAVGGGFAFSAYARRPRHTKDIDLYVLPADRAAMIEAVASAGFSDYYAQNAYDRNWIYRGFRDGIIVDIIWQMANDRAAVDDAWLVRGPEVEVRGLGLRLVPPEELVWTKLYVVHRDRCDWPDLLNMLYVVGPELDWEHLLSRVGEDRPLLASLVAVFGWLCPDRARELPPWIWGRIGVSEPGPGPSCAADRRRVALLDRRDWFGPTTGR